MDANGASLNTFLPVGDTQVAIVPHFVRVLTEGILDSYPADTAVTLLFDATNIDSLTGLPDEGASFSAINGSLTPDITALNAADWDFVRFLVEFDLNTSGGSVNLDTPRPGIDLMRISFRF